jgi:hypothetical protein
MIRAELSFHHSISVDLRQLSESPQASPQGRGARRRSATGLRASLSEQLAFYVDLVNSDRFLPFNMIGDVMRDAMLAKGLTTTQQLRIQMGSRA